MKKRYIVIALISLIGLNSCGSNEESSTDGVEETVELSTEDLSEELEVLKSLDGQLINAPAKNLHSAANSLYKASMDFLVQHPHHEKTVYVMELAAKSCEAKGNYQEAVNILDKMIVEFPNGETTKYLLNKARVQEEKLGNIDAAKTTYDQLINDFPDDPFAQEAQNYVNTFLGKSDAEILMMLDSINAQ